ncbi:hypothetical protein PAXRUDRAFT_155153 [Paxillus rubicundulus Ve08.2h10]|uniref:HTH CENPB-type domain-containing protein n=1 Tax=Paxillus rubicundulus Ve08.2h10 TaxID=930991 RepID=A0A0D0DJN4_9AGAM|nr:hypothetical protein PAXRUDRAFT_155153 [Paxillus rubicundulus Ve08.2h10]
MKPLNILKKGLAKFQNQIQERKIKLLAKLKAGQPISEVDQAWLDDDGNLIDEGWVVEALDEASDYEQGIERLDSWDKLVVQKLQKLVGGGRKSDAPSKKQKCKDFNMPGPQKCPHEKIKPPAKSQKKENATPTQWIEILDWYHANGKNQVKMAIHFNTIYPSLHLKQPRISAWLKDELKWWAESKASINLSHSAKKVCQTQHPKVTEMLDLWVSKAMADNLLLTGEVLCQKWKIFADLVGVPDDECLKFSEGWLSRFKL